MYIVYEKNTGKIVRVITLQGRDPTWAEATTGLIDLAQYAGFSIADNNEVQTDSCRFEIKKDELGQPYLFRHKYIVMDFDGDWTIIRGWQRTICESQPTRITIYFKDESGQPVSVYGELRLHGTGIYISDTHMELANQTEVSILVTGLCPCQTQLEVHLYPTSHIFQPCDRGANEGRPFVRDVCRFHVGSRKTFLKASDQFHYELEIMASDGDGDGIKDILADGACIAMCTVAKKDSRGNVVPDNDQVRITTTHGRLTKERMQLTNGVGTFAIQSNIQTVTAQIRVEAVEENNKTIYGTDKIHFRLVREA